MANAKLLPEDICLIFPKLLKCSIWVGIDLLKLSPAMPRAPNSLNKLERTLLLTYIIENIICSISHSNCIIKPLLKKKYYSDKAMLYCIIFLFRYITLGLVILIMNEISLLIYELSNAI